MRTKFTLQRRSFSSRVWHEPELLYGQQYQTRAESISELRATIRYIADRYTFDFPSRYRIITNDGDPVERWKVRAGSARKLWRKQ